MIGVVASEEELPWVEEFFELFKTPWKRALAGSHYRVLLTTGEVPAGSSADLTIAYSSREIDADRDIDAGLVATEAREIEWAGQLLPIYGALATFRRSGGALRTSAGVVDYQAAYDGGTLHRIGYDLFQEVARLLTAGQPRAYAGCPSLDLHISFLRNSLDTAGVPFIEIPARPADADFVCCLTHDIDFFGIRRHVLDRTMVGFVMRGTWGTVIDTLRGRRPVREAFANLLAVLAFPLVILGLRRDFWQPLTDYSAADRGLPSTFFIVPFKDRPGVAPDGIVRAQRAVKYAARDIQTELREHTQPTTEFAVHGLDAWSNSTLAEIERVEIGSVTKGSPRGVRMHWLFWSDASARAIESAGFDYDSTWGYNDAVGYRAGTMQAFRLPDARDLMELPLIVMDTAMFYPDRMNLDRVRAAECCQDVLVNAEQFGGAVVVNWHDRSLVPERQWHRPYAQLLDELQKRRVWFATAADAVSWFRWRRNIRFASEAETGAVIVDGARPLSHLPPVRVVVRRGGPRQGSSSEHLFSGGRLAFSV